MRDRWTILCVLKSGKDFLPMYVARLAANLQRCFAQADRVVCLTDIPDEINSVAPQVICEPLVAGRDGWWNKTELYRDDIAAVYKGPFVYMDLDMLPLRPFTLPVPEKRTFLMWRDPMWRAQGEFNSSFMAWAGDFAFLFDDYTPELRRLFDKKGDQEYTRRMLQAKKGVTLSPIDEFVDVVDYKVDKLKGSEVPPCAAQVIGFHGKPRPWETTEPWLKEAFNGTRNCS